MGIVYLSGRDKQYRPIIVIDIYRIDLKNVNLCIIFTRMDFFSISLTIFWRHYAASTLFLSSTALYRAK